MDVRLVRSNGGLTAALKEVLKYATKGEKGSRAQPAHAAAVELAFRNVRRVGLGGAIRKVKIEESDSNSDDVRTADLHDTSKLACEVCGVVGEWLWCGIVPGEWVVANGGFGLLEHPPPQLRQ